MFDRAVLLSFTWGVFFAVFCWVMAVIARGKDGPKTELYYTYDFFAAVSGNGTVVVVRAPFYNGNDDGSLSGIVCALRWNGTNMWEQLGRVIINRV